MNFSRQVQTVLDILQDEVNGDIKSALTKMAPDYTMTWMDASPDGKSLFPTTKPDIADDMQEAYVIRGREYDIRNISESGDTVMIELIESYPNQKTGDVYRTPLVLVLEFKDGKIRTGRHYLDPTISRRFLSKEDIENAYKNTRGSILIIK